MFVRCMRSEKNCMMSLEEQSNMRTSCPYQHVIIFLFLKYEAQMTANYCPSLMHGFVGVSQVQVQMVLSSRICEKSSNCGCVMCSLNYRYSSQSYSHNIVGVFITYFILMYVFSLKELWFASLNVCGKYFGHEPLFFSSL